MKSVIPESRSSRWAVATLALSMLLSSLGTSIANVALPTLADALSASFQQTQWIVLAYLLAITALIVSVGRLGDVLGRRRLLLSGLVLFTTGAMLCGLAPTLWTLIAARMAQGLGAATMMALSMAFVTDTVPKERTGSAMGLLGAMSAVGTALGPSLGGLLIAGFGWRSIFLINLPLGLVTLALAHRYLPVDREVSKQVLERFDGLGTLFLALTLTAYALAVTLGRGHFGLLNVALLVVAAVGVGLFVRIESKAESPLIRLSMFRDPVLSTSCITSALVTTVVMATLVVGPFYLSGALLLSAARVGLVMSSGPIVAALVSVPAGRMVDRFGASRMSIAGLVSMAAGAFALPRLASGFGVSGYIGALVSITAGYALFQAANNTAVMTNVRADQRGVTSGVLNLSRNLGLITGASVMGAVFAFGSSATDVRRASPAAVTSGMFLTFVVALGLIIVALMLVTWSQARVRRLAAVASAMVFWVIVASAQEQLPRREIPLGGHSTLTISAEARLRFDAYDMGRPAGGDVHQQGLFRGLLGADVRVHSAIRIVAQVGTGQVSGRRNTATANFQNAASLQQLFIDARTIIAATTVGASIGRQEFADGPRQLLSVSDGPNLHRTWNGVRLYAARAGMRLGAFELRATRQERGLFDERINDGERLRGLNASLGILASGNANLSIDPFWIHSERPNFRAGGQVGLDARNTVGARLSGRVGGMKIDWTVAHQSGTHRERVVDAWAVFAVQSLVLSNTGWKPRLTAHVDVASGGDAHGGGTLTGFNQLYASTNYLGEGMYLSLSNLLMVAPGLAVTPTPRTTLLTEYGFARRVRGSDAAYAGLMRTYAGTQGLSGTEIGALLRVVGSWSVGQHLTLFSNYEHFAVGALLRRARVPSGSYALLGASLRY